MAKIKSKVNPCPNALTKVWTSIAGTVDLTNQFDNARYCSNRMTVIATGAATFNFKDGGGNAVAIVLDDNAILYLDDTAASTLESSTNVTVIVQWLSS